MGFFGDPPSPSRGVGMRIFHFGLDQKIPGEKSPKNSQSRGWGLGIFEDWGFFIPGIFFLGWDISPKSHLYLRTWQFLSHCVIRAFFFKNSKNRNLLFSGFKT